MKEYQKTVLPNGLRVITVPMQHVKSVTVLLLIGAGSRYERTDERGLSHFIEHMFFKGTKLRPNPQDIAGAIDAVGGEINAFTGEECTGFYMKVEATHLPLAIDLLSDMLLSSQFRPTAIERERGVIVEEINLYEDTPSRKVGEVYKELLYGDTSLGHSVAGTKKTVGLMKRAQFMRYIRELYVPENAVLVIAGQVPHTVSDLVASQFAGWKATQARQWDPVSSGQTEPALALSHKMTEQAHCVIGFRTYPLGHSTRYAEGLMSIIMAGNMSSRLFIEVRERRGLAYAIRGSSDHFLDAGNWSVYAGCDLNKVAGCVRVILAQLALLKQRGVTQTELKKAQDFVIGKLALDLEDSQSVASMMAGQELLERTIRTPGEIIENVRKVRVADVHELARSVLQTEKLNLAVVGPFEKKELFYALLDI